MAGWLSGKGDEREQLLLDMMKYRKQSKKHLKRHRKAFGKWNNAQARYGELRINSEGIHIGDRLFFSIPDKHVYVVMSAFLTDVGEVRISIKNAHGVFSATLSIAQCKSCIAAYALDQQEADDDATTTASQD